MKTVEVTPEQIRKRLEELYTQLEADPENEEVSAYIFKLEDQLKKLEKK